MKKLVFFLVVIVILVAAFIFWKNWSSSPATESSQDAHLLPIDTMDKGYLSFPVWIVDRSTTEALTFNPELGKPATISYKLTRDGDIRIRVTRRGQKDLVFRTLLDWSHQDFGAHEVQWDGRDASGNLVDNTKCFIEFQGDVLGHKKHDPSRCHELHLKILSPTEPGALIRQLSEVRLELVGDRSYGEESGYELRVYMDYRLVTKVNLEKKVAAFALPEVKNILPGLHLITINLDDRRDHVGVASLLVLVESQSKPGRAAEKSMKIEVDAVTHATPKQLAAPLEITNISTYDALHFELAQQDFGILSYELSRPAWVRIRLVARRDKELVLRTLVNWSQRPLGKNIEQWDGRNASGYWVDQKQCPSLFLIDGDSAEHAAHDRNKCGDILLQITQPQRGEALTGRAMVRVAFAGEKQGYLAKISGRLRIYVDYLLRREWRYAVPATGPFELRWDTTTVANGFHLITINLDDGYDHVGTASVKIKVQN